MSKDDFEVVAYKVLSYLYAYLRDDAAMRRVASHVSVHDEVQEAVRTTIAM